MIKVVTSLGMVRCRHKFIRRAKTFKTFIFLINETRIF